MIKPVPEDATYGSLLSEVSDIGADLLVEVLRKIQAGTVGSSRARATSRADDSGRRRSSRSHTSHAGTQDLS
jgi:methionyl-tRNA formyltransferase